MPLTICIFTSPVSENQNIANILKGHGVTAFIALSVVLIETGSSSSDILKDLEKEYKEDVFVFRNLASNWDTNTKSEEITKWIKETFAKDILPAMV